MLEGIFCSETNEFYIEGRRHMVSKDEFYRGIQAELAEIEEQGLTKRERFIQSSQSREIRVQGRAVLNFCANNYLGLANNEQLIEAGSKALHEFGLGLASVRFICGTQEIHKQLESSLARFLGMEDCILYSSCFDANAGLFETLLGAEDAVISDSLNHASIIDGVRLCKAKRYRYSHNDMEDLKAKLEEAQKEGARRILVTTDGAFSMDGELANLPEVVKLCEAHGALLHVDECHATGVLGKTGRGTAEHFGMMGKIDIITSTLGKALGGSAGGFTVAKKSIIDLLRQRSRPYLFSNTLAPTIVGASLACVSLLEESSELLARLHENTRYFRAQMREAGFQIRGENPPSNGAHPIVPVILGDARLAAEMADELLKEGIYVIGFSFPVVPKGEARIRVQISAAHSREDLDRAIQGFTKVAKSRGMI